ncbi:hypothetical protein FLAN108750_02935 [Flavobacterium antarcticum]|uniref:hypothetical protein n=1 Tax=Flavobacterium antarcticum TaxID=271155 RepID=UPI0003B3FCB4|nr:hypothetical protein [Flavobacterium antarcticum]
MEHEKYRHYLRDLIYLIHENIQEMKTEKNNDFELGLKCGYEQILETIKSQSIAFEIDLEEIGFNDYENNVSR